MLILIICSKNLSSCIREKKFFFDLAKKIILHTVFISEKLSFYRRYYLTSILNHYYIIIAINRNSYFIKSLDFRTLEIIRIKVLFILLVLYLKQFLSKKKDIDYNHYLLFTIFFKLISIQI